MTGVQQKQVVEGEDGMRLDRWFQAHFSGLSHGQLQKLLRKGQVRVDGGRCKASHRLQTGETVRIPPLPEPRQNTLRENRTQAPLSSKDRAFVRSLILVKDDDFIVLNKPPGLAVQGGSKQQRHLDGLLQGLQFKAPEPPRLVHRLDKDTSGVLMLARSRKAAGMISRLLKKRAIRKVYWALVSGVPQHGEATIDLPLKKRGGSHERMVECDEDDPDGRSAVTHYSVLDSAARKMAFVALMPVTGRTHQLRAHMSAIGHPIIGDGKYGGREAHPGGELSRKLHLHARSIAFDDPASNKRIVVHAPLPEHMLASWALLGFDTESPEDPFDDPTCKGACDV